ncbi:MAG: hypothetical protein EB069_08595, partial [Actinobacteria bacterium]|nr:hypothetical protein [Actinomycetota bacterium]
YQAALDTGEDFDPIYAEPTLSDDSRQVLSRLHPSFMGGEYLPDQDPQEVEIARIVIRSTTRDVTCVYAAPHGKRIAYRIVDEYGGDTLSGPDRLISNKPLTLGALRTFFLSGWDLLQVLDYNGEYWDYNEDQVLDFIVEASSDFYPEFGQAVMQKVQRWLSAKHRSQRNQRRREAA